MKPLRIAFQMLRRTPVQSALIVLGITIGIATQIFIGSLATSLQTYLIDTTLGPNPQLIVASAKTDGFVVLDRKLQSALTKSTNIKRILPERDISVVITRGSLSTPLYIRCGDPQTLDETYRISPTIKKGLYILGDNKVVIGTIFAERNGLSPGRNIFLTVPGKPVEKLTVTGIADFGTKQLNETLAYSDDRFGQTALGLTSDQYSMIVLQLNDVFGSTANASAINKADPNVRVANWQVEQKDLASGLRAQANSTLLIQILIIIAVAFEIASTLSISAIQKIRQNGVSQESDVAAGATGPAFLWQGVLLGLPGVSGGLLLGIALIALFQVFSAGRPGSFSVHPQAGFFMLSFALGLIVAVLATYLPSRLLSGSHR